MEFLRSTGHTLDEFLEEFPSVTRDAAIVALEYAKGLVIALRDEGLDRPVLATRRKILLTRMRFFAYLLETPDGPLC